MKLLGKCAIEMANKEDKEDLFVGPTFVFAKVEISFKEVGRSQGRHILKAHQSGSSLSNLENENWGDSDLWAFKGPELWLSFITWMIFKIQH